MVYDQKQKKEIVSFDYDPAVDFRVLGKST